MSDPFLYFLKKLQECVSFQGHFAISQIKTSLYPRPNAILLSLKMASMLSYSLNVAVSQFIGL